MHLNKSMRKTFSLKKFQKWPPDVVLLSFSIIWKIQAHIQCRIVLSRQILFNVLTITVKYSFKSQKSRFNGHANQIIGNNEDVTENTFLEFWQCCCVVTTYQLFEVAPRPKHTGNQVWGSCRPDMMKLATEDKILCRKFSNHI